MDKAVLYLQKCKIKNRIISIFKKPSSILVIIFLVAMLVLTIIGGGSPQYGAAANMNELYSIVLLLFGFVFVTTSYGGISKGASLFSMADVNFLFVAPKKPVSILIYGLIQQMGTSLLLGLFIVFQYTIMHSRYGVGFDFLIVSLIMYAVCAFCGQLTAMVIYTLTSSSDKKRTTAKYLVIAVAAAFVLYAAYKIYLSGNADYLSHASEIGATFTFSMFPVAGWARLVLMGIYAESVNFVYIALGLLMTAVYVTVMVTLVVVKQSDYYEDVLKATEVSFNAINARKEGKLSEPIPQNVKVGKIGIDSGWGVNVIYVKHKIESRRSKLFIFDTLTLIYMAIAVVFAFFLRGEGILPIFSFMTYLQIFTVALGRWGKVLQLPYIYLIPEKPFKKLLLCLKESIIKIVFDSIVSFVIIGLILKLDVPVIIGCIVARISFGILLTASNLFVDRFFGGINIKAVTLILYFFLTMLFAAPGVIGIITVMTFMGETAYSMLIGFLLMGTCNFAVSALVLFASRNVLTYSELNNR